MQTIIGVRFKKAGKIFYFSPGNLTIAQGDDVVVETSRGVECGKAVVGPREVEDSEIKAPLKVVLRIATPQDHQRIEDNKKSQQEAFGICEAKIAEHGLPMKLVEVEYTFDLSKIIFYFTADGRIDFRDLVKDLASVFRTRIELRQIGVRDEAKLMGGIGCCGRPLCCASFLGDFEPVSIRMAKEQNLSLNPTKISGICGRLMCCLKYENDCYESGVCGGCHKSCAVQEPEQGSRVISAEGEGKVISVNQQKRTATVLLDNSRTIVVSWEDIVNKDEDEAENTAPSRVFRRPLPEDDEDEADARLIAAITERSARNEFLGGEEEEGGQGGHGRSRERRNKDRKPHDNKPRERRKRPDGGRDNRNASRGERRNRDNEGSGRREHSERSSRNRNRRPRRDRNDKSDRRGREDRNQERGE